jgi:catechol 2,3-dioxygenase-like lactoylglutathione lyase family enzyme
MLHRCLPLYALAAASLFAQTRPPIIGVAHVALRTNDLAAARQFYKGDLGLIEQPMAVFRVNDHQYIQLSADLKDDADDRLINVAFETTDVRQLRDYLASRGMQASLSDMTLSVKDPEGRIIEFVQYDSNAGHAPFLQHRISARIIHAGFIVQDRAAEDRFYKDILGFTEMWHGGKTGVVAVSETNS